jgi:hypothetical protein
MKWRVVGATTIGINFCLKGEHHHGIFGDLHHWGGGGGMMVLPGVGIRVSGGLLAAPS